MPVEIRESLSAIEVSLLGEVRHISSLGTKTPPRGLWTLTERIEHYAALYGVSAEEMTEVIDCESGGNPRALGDSGKSRGLVQINRDYHPDISDNQAFDIDFSLDFLAENLAKGNGKWWTCWRNLQ